MESEHKAWAICISAVVLLLAVLTCCLTFYYVTEVQAATKAGLVQKQNSGGSGYHWDVPTAPSAAQ